jgi:RHS repeat-associated protein
MPPLARCPIIAETGLDFFGARYCSGAQGRFTSPGLPFMDQNVFDPQSWNLYTYARNNSLRYVDPTGMARCLYAEGETPEGGPATDEKACTESGGTMVYQPTDTDDPNADASAFQFSVTETENTDELDAKGQAVVDQLAENADSSIALIGTIAGGSAAVGGGAALAPVAGQAVNELALGSAVGRVFYRFSRIAAAGAAGRLIGERPTGQVLNFLPLPDAVKGVGWNVLSRFWASGAAGTVNVFAETGRRVGVLYTTELPRLLNNPYVQSIRYR